jgi:hypothetical protein
MELKLDKPAYRRLVQLYLVSFLLLIGAAVYSVVDPVLSSFDADFQELVGKHFRHAAASDVMAAVGGMFLVTHLGATIGLLWFKAWARLLFWSSFLITYAITVIFEPPVYYSTSWLFGAIIILSYSKDHGVIWFSKPDSPNS